MENENRIDCDLLIIGAGPAGLAAAIRAKQISPDIHVIILEKGAEIGAHNLSGAVMDPIALNTLLPDWYEQWGKEETCLVEKEELNILAAEKSYKIPHFILSKKMANKGCYVVSLSSLCRWLGEKAMEMNIDIFPAFPAQNLIYDENNAVIGAKTKDMGIDKKGIKKDIYQEGVEIYSAYTFIAEGSRGYLAQKAIQHFNLAAPVQTYGLGIKELWQVPDENIPSSQLMHFSGWPLIQKGSDKNWGGGFVYYLGGGQVYVGFITALDYDNPYLSPYDEFQRFKSHKNIRKILEGGERLEYGARSVTEGGLQSLPKLTAPGLALLGCSAGFLDFVRIKGIHTAMESGMVAAGAACEAIKQARKHDILEKYSHDIEKSWVYKDLKRGRNMRPAVAKWGALKGVLFGGMDYMLKGSLPLTLSYAKSDRSHLKTKEYGQKIDYPPYDNIVSFDKQSSLALASVHHDEDQPSHLLCDGHKMADNREKYDSPETRYCPAAVYEWMKTEEGAWALQVNASNCLHCKTCDIKDPLKNITWSLPEGGGGPNYRNI